MPEEHDKADLEEIRKSLKEIEATLNELKTNRLIRRPIETTAFGVLVAGLVVLFIQFLIASLK
jgi:hypothetical protein